MKTLPSTPENLRSLDRFCVVLGLASIVYAVTTMSAGWVMYVDLAASALLAMAGIFGLVKRRA